MHMHAHTHTHTHTHAHTTQETFTHEWILPTFDCLQAKAFFIILIMHISEHQLKMVEFRGKCMYFHNN